MNPFDGQSLDRSSHARQTRRRLSRSGWVGEVIAQSRRMATTLKSSSDENLLQHALHLKQVVRSQCEAISNDEILVLAAAAVIEAIRRSLGMELFDVQLHAGLIVSCGAVAEMQTGEGKTLSAILPALVRSLSGHGVHVATPNDYLAKRDHDKLAAAFKLLGINTALLVEGATVQEKKLAYNADITYGAAHGFGFDYLRDQLTLDAQEGDRLGDRLYRFATSSESAVPRMQRRLASAIVDEIDHVLIDDAVSPLLLSGSGDGEARDADIHREALHWGNRLVRDVDYHWQAGTQVELTQAGFDHIYSRDAASLIVHPELIRPWHEYVVQAIRAKHGFRRDVHYVVRKERVQIVDASTGRIFEDRTWSDGLQQAIEAREGLVIQAETKPLARVTRQRFFRQYSFIGGMTGTATGCEKEFASVYGLAVEIVPLRSPSKRILLTDHVTRTASDKTNAIADETEAMIAAGRAVLIGTLSISESMAVATELRSRNLRFQLLNGVQDADEATLISQAGRSGSITVATNLAGRGTDIILDPSVARAGGLHVIVAQRHPLARVDRQLIGRCARCGDAGSARVFVSAEDEITNTHAPWIARSIQRWNDRGRTGHPDLRKQIHRVQVRQQRLESVARRRLLRADRSDEKLFAKSKPNPDGCWQL